MVRFGSRFLNCDGPEIQVLIIRTPDLVRFKTRTESLGPGPTRFGPWTLDSASESLSQRGKAVKMTQKAKAIVGYIKVDDGRWRRNVLITRKLYAWWHVRSVEDRLTEFWNYRHHKVTNIIFIILIFVFWMFMCCCCFRTSKYSFESGLPLVANTSYDKNRRFNCLMKILIRKFENPLQKYFCCSIFFSAF